MKIIGLLPQYSTSLRSRAEAVSKSMAEGINILPSAGRIFYNSTLTKTIGTNKAAGSATSVFRLADIGQMSKNEPDKRVCVHWCSPLEAELYRLVLRADLDLAERESEVPNPNSEDDLLSRQFESEGEDIIVGQGVVYDKTLGGRWV